jgi:uncharacterized protein involved in exopolysaccharide biosynthesis
MNQPAQSGQFQETHLQLNPLQDICQALLRHKKKAAGCFIVTMAVTVLITCLMTKAYRSEAKLLVRLGRENATLDPTVMSTNEAVMTIPQSREDEINSIAEILGSRVMLEQVVDAVGPAVILGVPESETSDEPATHVAHVRTIGHAKTAAQASWIPPLPLLTPVAPRDRAIIALKRDLRVAPIRKSNVISVSYESDSPEAAQEVVAKLVEFYIREHARLNRNLGAWRFLSEETDRLRVELKVAEEKLCDLKNQSEMTSGEEQRKVLTNQIGSLEDDLRKSQAAAAASSKKIALLMEKIAETPEREVSGETAGVGDMGTENMRGQLYALQLREKQVAASHTDAHPMLQEVRRQVSQAKQVLAQEEPTRRHVTTTPSRARQQLESLLLAEQPVLAALEAEGSALEKQLALVRQQLKVFNRDEMRIATLQREIELMDSSYRRASANFEQARIDESQANERISNINVAQPASYEAKPVRPRVAINLACGLVAGCCGALALSMSAQRSERSKRALRG